MILLRFFIFTFLVAILAPTNNAFQPTLSLLPTATRRAKMNESTRTTTLSQRSSNHEKLALGSNTFQLYSSSSSSLDEEEDDEDNGNSKTKTRVLENVVEEVDDTDNNHDENDDEIVILPYLNRTLAWTKRYRKLVPYESARRTAMRLGLQSQQEWEDIREFGKAFQGAHSVSRPDIMYANEWISWEEFLGVMRPYEDAKDVVQNRLPQNYNVTLRTMEEYRDWVRQNVKLAEDLRIPAKPDIVYKNKGWISPEDFFGNKD